MCWLVTVLSNYICLLEVVVAARRGHQCGSVPTSGHQCGDVRVVLLQLNVDGRVSMSLWCTVTVYHKTQS